MLKKLFTTVLGIAACLSFTFTPALANESTENINAIDEEGKEYYWSDEHQAKLREKINSNDVMPMSDGTKILSVPHYTQENSHYCAPASAQVIIKYVTGNYYSQYDLATRMKTSNTGTYVNDFTPVLKSLTGADYEYTDTNQYYFYNNMVQDINANFPVVYDVDAYYFDIGYSHIGHMVVGNGYGPNNLCYYWDVNGPFADQWHISASEMQTALIKNGGYYVW